MGVILNGECQRDFQGESESKLAEQFRDESGAEPSVRFINDVEGMAQSVIHHQNIGAFFIRLTNPDKEDIPTNIEMLESKPRILFTMGTGTGLSLILPHSKSPLILPTEAWASHLSVNMDNPRQVAVGDYLVKKKKTKASLLKFLKGPAVLNLYTFMYKVWAPQKYTAIEKSVKKQLKIKQIDKRPLGVQECVTYAAINDLDPLCSETIDFLYEIVAVFLQKVSLTFLPSAIYIGGGLGNGLSEYFEKNQNQVFWGTFLDHQMKESVLDKIQVYVMRENPTLDAMEVVLAQGMKSE